MMADRGRGITTIQQSPRISRQGHRISCIIPCLPFYLNYDPALVLSGFPSLGAVVLDLLWRSMIIILYLFTS
jgi:hypothetical protein